MSCSHGMLSPWSRGDGETDIRYCMECGAEIETRSRIHPADAPSQPRVRDLLAFLVFLLAAVIFIVVLLS